jgi:uncharacterized protein DUF6468
VSNGLGLIIESLVAILLMLTIAYCILLNTRLKNLRADEQVLKATISELITATEIAERAIAGLKLTVRDCDQTLGERLRTADRFAADITRQVAAGEAVLARLTRITTTVRQSEAARAPVPAPVAPPVPASVAPPVTDAKATAVAAQAFAARARLRLRGVAA